MSKPRGQKAPRRFPTKSGFELPVTSRRFVPTGGYGCKRGTMKTGLGVTFCAILIGQFVIASSTNAAPKSAPAACGDDTRTAVAQARSALEAESIIDDRAALVCLLEAVAALHGKLEGLSHGTTPFDGQIYAPKGVAITKPSAKEDR